MKKSVVVAAPFKQRIFFLLFFFLLLHQQQFLSFPLVTHSIPSKVCSYKKPIGISTVSQAVAGMKEGKLWIERYVISLFIKSKK
jgi:hypothetical protein